MKRGPTWTSVVLHRVSRQDRTARSMGVSQFADVGLRELSAAGRIESPERRLGEGDHDRPLLVVSDVVLNRLEW